MCQAFDGEFAAVCREEARAKPCTYCGEKALYAPPFKPLRCNACHLSMIRDAHPLVYGGERGHEHALEMLREKRRNREAREASV